MNVKRIITAQLIHHGNVSHVIVIDWEQIHQIVHQKRVPVNADQVYLVVNATNARIRKDYISFKLNYSVYIHRIYSAIPRESRFALNKEI